MFIDTNIDVPMSAPEGISRERIFDATPHSKVREEGRGREGKDGIGGKWKQKEWEGEERRRKESEIRTEG